MEHYKPPLPPTSTVETPQVSGVWEESESPIEPHSCGPGPKSGSGSGVPVLTEGELDLSAGVPAGFELEIEIHSSLDDFDPKFDPHADHFGEVESPLHWPACVEGNTEDEEPAERYLRTKACVFLPRARNHEG